MPQTDALKCLHLQIQIRANMEVIIGRMSFNFDGFECLDCTQIWSIQDITELIQGREANFIPPIPAPDEWLQRGNDEEY